MDAAPVFLLEPTLYRARSSSTPNEKTHLGGGFSVVSIIVFVPEQVGTRPDQPLMDLTVAPVYRWR